MQPDLAVCPFEVDRPVMLHRWEQLTFLHWSYEPADVQRLLPPGLVSRELNDIGGIAERADITPLLRIDDHLRTTLLAAEVFSRGSDDLGLDRRWRLRGLPSRCERRVGGSTRWTELIRGFDRTSAARTRRSTGCGGVRVDDLNLGGRSGAAHAA